MKRMLSFENISKSYGEKDLFHHINGNIASRDRIGLIGVNGTGKSTFLQVIAGVEPADSGEIQHAKAYRIEYLQQNPHFEEEMTVLDYIYSGDSDVMRVMRRHEAALLNLANHSQDERAQTALLKAQQQMDRYEAWEASTIAKTVLTKLGVTFFDQLLTHFSGGQKKRVAIAKALMQPADLLILDEPTNHLDNETIVWLEQYLANYQGALLIVTHDCYFLDRVTNRIFELEQGNLYEYGGNYEVFLEKKLERETLERQMEEKHRNTLRQEMAWLKRGARARSTKQKARKERIEIMRNQTFHTEEENVSIDAGSTRLGKKVIELVDIQKTIGERRLFSKLNLLITPGDLISIIGHNGAGKSSLLDVIQGNQEIDEGEIIVGDTVKIGYYKQGEEELPEDVRVIEYIQKVAEVIYTAKGKEITAAQMLERLLFPRRRQWSYIKGLSGGEKRRLYLLKVLMQEPNVLLLDEPTNDLDIQTLGVLENYLEQFPGVVLTVSHDRYFLDHVVDELLVFDGEGEVQHLYGDYSENKATLEAAPTKNADKKTKKTPRPKQQKKKLSYQEKKEWETIEDEITNLEEKIEEIKTEIAASGSDIEKVQRLYEEQQTIEATLDNKMERWEELSLLVESFG